jgi:hypothetical protein
VTFEEVSSFGILLNKLLETLRDTDEEQPAHYLLIKKIELLLGRQEWFAIENSIRLLWDIKGYFPKYKTHHGRLVELCGSLDVPAKGRDEVNLRLHHYIHDLAKMPMISAMVDLEEVTVPKDETTGAEPDRSSSRSQKRNQSYEKNRTLQKNRSRETN